MEILSERGYDGTERNAFNIISPYKMYTVKIETEPVMIFTWDLDRECWAYEKHRLFPHTEQPLEPNQIAVEIPIDDSTPVTHKPYVNDMSHPDVVAKLEKAVMMVAELPEPACAMRLKKALRKLKH
jgi:hypothetical protein